jgi:hypothetical protein
MSRAYIAFPLALLALAGCLDPGSGPTLQTGDVRLEGKITRNTLNLGDTTSLEFRIRNLGADSLRLSFVNGCQAAFAIREDRSDTTVYPGNQPCLAVLASFVLSPGEERLISGVIHGGAQETAPPDGLSLATGRYVAYTRVLLDNVVLRSNPVLFTVR